MAAPLPSFLVSSPAGIHISDFHAFVKSDLLPDLSNDREKSQWASDEVLTQVSRMFTSGPEGATPSAILSANLLVFNKSRDIDRVCPACLRWYRVGEAFKSYSSLDEFLARPKLDKPEIEKDVAEEQDLSGMCTRQCMKILNDGSDGVFGKDAEELSAEDITRLDSGNTAMSVRKPTAEEQAQGFKLVFIQS